MESLSKYFNVLIVVAAGAGLLLLTPIGGVAKVFIGGLALIGGVVLIGKSLFDIFDLTPWKEIRMQVSIGLGLIAFSIILGIVLPDAPAWLQGDRDRPCRVSRYESC